MKKASRPQKILFIDANLDGTIGGSHYCLLEIVQVIDRKKYEPVVLFFEHNSLKEDFEKVCIVHVFERNNRLNFRQSLPLSLRRIPLIQSLFVSVQKVGNLFLYTIPEFIRILFFLKKSRIELVHINNAPYLSDWLLACKIMGIKCTAHLRGNWKPGWFRKKLIIYYDAVIAISNSVRGYIAKEGVKTDNFVIINDGIDINIPQTISPLTRDELINDLKLPKQMQCVVGLVGNIKPWKGQHTLIDAISIFKKTHPFTRGLIIGDVGRMSEDIEYFEHLKDKVRENRLEEHVFFTGFRRDVLRIVSCLDILVHTSTDPEPFGRVILEGMLLSKPVIATAHGGPLDIVEDGISGFLVPPDNPGALADALVRLSSDQVLRENIGRQAETRVEQCFSLKGKVKEIEDVYERVLSAT